MRCRRRCPIGTGHLWRTVLVCCTLVGSSGCVAVTATKAAVGVAKTAVKTTVGVTKTVGEAVIPDGEDEDGD